MDKTKEDEKIYVLSFLSKAKEMKLSVKEIGKGLLLYMDKPRDFELPEGFMEYLEYACTGLSVVEKELSELEEKLQEALYKLL